MMFKKFCTVFHVKHGGANYTYACDLYSNKYYKFQTESIEESKKNWKNKTFANFCGMAFGSVSHCAE